MNNTNKRLQSLARNHCAAFTGSDGCRFEPNGQSKCSFFRDDPRALPFIESGDMRCLTFERGVLPNDPELEARYFNRSVDVVKCEKCSAPIIRKSNRQKYCGGCGIEASRKARNKRTQESRHRSKSVTV